MVLSYKIIFLSTAKRDLKRIGRCDGKRKIKKILAYINTLAFMPYRNKTLYSIKDINGDYRRMLCDKYAIIYRITKEKVVIMRIFYQKQNYLNSRNFILREKSEKYTINK